VPIESSSRSRTPKILDAAFKMTEQLVGATNQLAQRIVTVTENALDEVEKNSKAAKK
jgi:hypothetical protein